MTEDANSQLGELKPPEALQSAYDRYLAARDRVIDQMKHGKDAAESQDSAAYGAGPGGGRARRPAAKEARSVARPAGLQQ